MRGELVPRDIDLYICMEHCQHGDLFHFRWVSRVEATIRIASKLEQEACHIHINLSARLNLESDAPARGAMPEHASTFS